MFQSLKEPFGGNDMKKDVVEYDSKWLTCQKSKTEHKHPAEELQPIELPEWKWDRVISDFVVGLPKTIEGYDTNLGRSWSTD